MPNYQKTMLIGHLCADTELKFMTDGTGLATNCVAVTSKYTKKDGEKAEETLFMPIEVWGKPAETIAKYTAKGDPIMVEGSLKEDKWEKDGVKHSKIKLRVQTFQFLGGKKKGETNGESPDAQNDVPF